MKPGHIWQFHHPLRLADRVYVLCSAVTEARLAHDVMNACHEMVVDPNLLLGSCSSPSPVPARELQHS